jgi:hypothetical protein
VCVLCFALLVFVFVFVLLCFALICLWLLYLLCFFYFALLVFALLCCALREIGFSLPHAAIATMRVGQVIDHEQLTFGVVGFGRCGCDTI